jgi:aquaporin Z
MLSYIIEFLGTFLFLSVFVATAQPIIISLALLLVLMLGAGISGGHYNPAISLMFWAKGSLTAKDLFAYVVAQCLGGLGALTVYNTLI